MYNCKCHYIRIKMVKNCYEDVSINKSMYCFLIKFVLRLHGKAGSPSHINTMTILRENRAGAEWASPVKWASPANQAGSSHRNRFHRFSAFSRTRPDSFFMIREMPSLEILGAIFVPERICDATIHASTTLRTVSILGSFVWWLYIL